VESASTIEVAFFLGFVALMLYLIIKVIGKILNK